MHTLSAEKASGDLSVQRALRVLAAVEHVGPIAVSRLLEAFNNDPWAILKAGKHELMSVYGIGPVTAQAMVQWRSKVDLDRDDQLMEACGSRYVSLLDPEYPEALKQLPDRPVGFYTLGFLPAIESHSVAIVGSRRATLYGRAVAKRLASELAEMGFTIVSGLARGIDAAAHEGALDVGGKTVAVLGCGVDLVYPPEHIGLYEKIKKTGLVISEFPMGRPADRYTFPARNRLVSGLSQAVIVVESDVNGGSMITAHMAAEQGRHVFAVPGRVDQSASRGCHELIREGATLIRSAQDIIDELRYLESAPRRLVFPKIASVKGKANRSNDMVREKLFLEGYEATVYASLEGTAGLDLDAIGEATGLPISAVSSTLLMLELKKCVVKRLDGKFEVRS
jgi:DNA processing protein